MKFGITGLPKSGKTTLFNLLTGSDIDTGKFAATKEEVHRGIAHVSEPRLNKLADVFGASRKVEVALEFLDFGGLSLGADRESKLLGDLRTVDAIVHVLRAFEDPEIPHPAGSMDPARDAFAQEAEMIINDLIVIENRLPRLESQISKARTDELIHEKEVLDRIKEYLEQDHPLRELSLPAEDELVIKGYGFLSAKPLLLALNVGDDELGALDMTPARWKLEDFAKGQAVDVCPVSLELELEIDRLNHDDKAEFLKELGIETVGPERLAQTAYRLLNLITFFTGNEKETRAWALRRGSTALEAAGTIHTDMARGFIRAEVIPYEKLIEAGSFTEARSSGTLRVESRDYIIQDGEVVNIRFNV